MKYDLNELVERKLNYIKGALEVDEDNGNVHYLVGYRRAWLELKSTLKRLEKDE